MKLWFLIGSVVLLAGACASAPPAPKVEAPQWYTDLAGTYPSDSYLSFMGSGTTAQEARQDALNQMSGYFGMSVQTFTSGFESYLEKKIGDEVKSEYDRQVSTNVKVTSNEKLFTVEYTTPFSPKTGDYAVAAYMSRGKAAVTWQGQIAPLAGKVQYLIGVAKDKAKPIGQRLSAWKGAQVLAALIPPMEKNYNLVKPEGTKELNLGFSTKDLMDLKTELTTLGAIEVVFTGDEVTRFAPMFEDKLSKAGFLTGKGGSLKLLGSAKITQTPGSYGLTNSEWLLDVHLKDGSTAIFDLQLTGRGGGSNENAAKANSVINATKAVDDKFIPGLTEKFASFLE